VEYPGKRFTAERCNGGKQYPAMPFCDVTHNRFRERRISMAGRFSFLITALTRTLLLPGLLLLAGCSGKAGLSSISIGAPQSPLASLIWLTDELDYFTEQGIDLEVNAYPSGKRALSAMMAGNEDLAATAETPFVIASFQRPDLRLFATIGQSDNEIRLLARRDHGIEEPADLAGRTIATQEGSAVHFFLSSFLLYSHIDPAGSRIRFMDAEALPAALVSGEVDAISMRDPFLSQARMALGADRLVEFSVPGLYTKTYNIAGSDEFLSRYPGTMSMLLAALNRGAEFARSYPDQAIQIIARRLQLPEERIVAAWPDIRLTVTLNQSLLTTLQEEARWAVATGQVKGGNDRFPDFLTRLDSAPLAKAVSDAVGLIGVAPE